MNLVPFLYSSSNLRFPFNLYAMRLQVGNPRPSPLVKSCTSANGLKRLARFSSGMPLPVSVTMNCPVCALRFLNSNVIFPLWVCFAALSSNYIRMLSKASALVRTFMRGTFKVATTSGWNDSLALFMICSQRALMFMSFIS